LLRKQKGGGGSPAPQLAAAPALCNTGVTEPAPCPRREEGLQTSFIPWVFLAVQVYLRQWCSAREEMLSIPSQRLCQVNSATNTQQKKSLNIPRTKMALKGDHVR